MKWENSEAVENALGALIVFAKDRGVFQIKMGPHTWVRRWHADTLKSAIAQEVARSKKSLAELASAMTRFPQILINVKGVAKEKLASNSAISDAVIAAETTLGSSGRVLLRASGTENLVRVMVEASSDNLASEVATTLADVVKKELAL